MRILKVAVVFLTRLPVRLEPWHDTSELARATRFFPVVGAVLGLVVALVFVVAGLLLPPWLAATVAVGAGILLTGGLHEDALGDVADGFGGGWDSESVLRIMKDPRQGTYGVLAMVLAVLLRIGALAELGPEAAWAVLPAVGALSRVGMVWMLWRHPSARKDGAGAGTAKALTGADVGWCLLLGLAAAIPLKTLLAPGVLLAGFAAWYLGRLATRRIGGVTGDVAGASQQLGEVLILLMVVALSRPS